MAKCANNFCQDYLEKGHDDDDGGSEGQTHVMCICAMYTYTYIIYMYMTSISFLYNFALQDFYKKICIIEKYIGILLIVFMSISRKPSEDQVILYAYPLSIFLQLFAAEGQLQ